MSVGWERRLDILRRDGEQKILALLKTHGWTAVVEREVEDGEYLVIRAERGGQTHCVALMYTSGTKNAVYKRLATEVEHIFINGQLYQLESFAYGIDTPITTADDFQHVLVVWNDGAIDVTVIRDYLGHASVATTSRYVTSNLQMKREVLDAFWKRAGLSHAGRASWKPKPELLRFLSSL